MDIPDLVIRKDGKEQVRIGCGCLFILLFVIFFTVYGIIQFFGIG